MAPSALECLNKKIERAEKHLIDLGELIQDFIASSPYEIVSYDDADRLHKTFKVNILKSFPLDIAVIIGDVLQNFRSTLDHLAYHLVSIGPPGRRATYIYFPIFESATKYEAEKMRKIQGMGDPAIKVIDAIQPYKRGNGHALWTLQTMNNRDKHSLLIPAWMSVIGRSFYRSERVVIETALKDTFPTGLPDGFMVATPGINFLEDGAELMTVPISELDNYMDFRISIAFKEPLDVRGKEVMSVLDGIRGAVKSTVKTFSDKGFL
jgi:hypothetical protein